MSDPHRTEVKASAGTAKATSMALRAVADTIEGMDGRFDLMIVVEEVDR